MLPAPSHNVCEISEEDKLFLRPTNPRLLELKQLYRHAHRTVAKPSRWDKVHLQTQLEWPYIRGDNAYIWQHRDGNGDEAYKLTAAYLKKRDTLGLYEKLKEDGVFGVYTSRMDDGKMVSRDLLDSINEIQFLEDAIGISSIANLKVLDIGAGYGRLAHRMVSALDNLDCYICADAIPESTFLQEYYVGYRGIENKVTVKPLPEIRNLDGFVDVSLAVNIHSFSECTLSAIKWWITRLQKSSVKYLFVIPNPQQNLRAGKILYSHERSHLPRRFDWLLESYGYTLIKKQPKYLDLEVQRRGVTPTYYYLFELTRPKPSFCAPIYRAVNSALSWLPV